VIRIKCVVTICCILSISSCGKIDPLVELSSFQEFVIPAGLSTIESHYFVQNNTPILYESTIANSGIDAADVENFVASTASLVPANGRDFDLGFVRSVNVFLVEPDGRRHELFYIDQVPLGEKQRINMLNGITNLKDIIMNDRATIETKLDFYTPPITNREIRVNMTFAVI